MSRSVRSNPAFPRLLLPALAACLLAACSTTLPTLPPLSDSGIEHPGKIVWHDLVTPDPSRAKAFYGALLGWTFEQLSDGYWLARNDGIAVAGIAALNSSQGLAHWLAHMSVPDVDAATDLARSEGGEILLKPFELPGRGRVAVIRDPQGAAFALLRTRGGDPVDGEPLLNGWLWNEIWTRAPDQGVPFYRTLTGLRSDRRQVDGIDYRYLAEGESPRFGLIDKPGPELANTWVSYIRVDDARVAAATVPALGGKVLLAPRQGLRDSTVTIISDPNGAGLVLQEWSP
jgi:predicted enzyme related to lactoylglutathione lyase